jgi:NMD protein affecting ribosome stability and mRNA decay
MQRDVRKFGISDKRGRQPTSVDPFVPEEGLKEPTVCTSCKSIYQQKTWSHDPDAYRRLEADPKTNLVNCPACQKVAAGYAEGIVTLSGSYLWEHEEEIRRILANEEHKAREKNPQERVIRRLREGDKLVIETTEKKLAEHFGRVLHKAHQGELDIFWTGDPEICRVSWDRTL